MIKLNKIILSIFLVFALISTSFAVGIYEKNDAMDGGYNEIITQFTNLSSPKIDLNVTAFKSPLDIESAVLFFDDNLWNFKIDSDIIAPGQEKEFNFDTNSIAIKNLDFNLKDFSNVRFKLTVNANGKEVRPLGDETEFFLKYENRDVSLNSFNYEDRTVELLFNGDVSKAIISLNGKSYTYNNINSDVKLKKQSGEIITIGIASIVGVTGNPGQANYSASKAGMIGMTKCLAAEVATRGVTANCIAPGFIRTPMTDVLTDDQKANLTRNIPAGKLGEAQDIANCVAFLASDEASYMTGQTLHINGGMAMI